MKANEIYEELYKGSEVLVNALTDFFPTSYLLGEGIKECYADVLRNEVLYGGAVITDICIDDVPFEEWTELCSRIGNSVWWQFEVIHQLKFGDGRAYFFLDCERCNHKDIECVKAWCKRLNPQTNGIDKKWVEYYSQKIVDEKFFMHWAFYRIEYKCFGDGRVYKYDDELHSLDKAIKIIREELELRGKCFTKMHLNKGGGRIYIRHEESGEPYRTFDVYEFKSPKKIEELARLVNVVGVYSPYVDKVIMDNGWDDIRCPKEDILSKSDIKVSDVGHVDVCECRHENFVLTWHSEFGCMITDHHCVD